MTVGQALERAEELRPGSRIDAGHPAGVAEGSRRDAAGTLF